MKPINDKDDDVTIYRVEASIEDENEDEWCFHVDSIIKERDHDLLFSDSPRINQFVLTEIERAFSQIESTLEEMGVEEKSRSVTLINLERFYSEEGILEEIDRINNR